MFFPVVPLNTLQPIKRSCFLEDKDVHMKSNKTSPFLVLVLVCLRNVFLDTLELSRPTGGTRAKDT